MLSINFSELIWTIINFFLLLFVLKRFLIGPMVKHLDARQARIDQSLEARRQADEAIWQADEAAEAQRQSARQEAGEILALAGKDAEARSRESLEQARAQSGALLQQEEDQARLQARQERQELEAGQQKLADALAGRLLNRKG